MKEKTLRLTQNTLLQEFETLSHDARVQRMVVLGHQTAADPDVVALLDEMEQGGFYQRFLALHSCFGSRDGSRVVRALSDPSRRMQGLARRLLTVVGSDSEVAAALGSLSPRNLPGVLRRLFKRGRQSAIDAYLASLPPNDEERRPQIVAFGSAEVVARHKAVFLASAGLPDWNRLARLHPSLAVKWLQERADTAESLDLRLIAHANAALHFLADSRPDETLQLVQSLIRHTSLPQLFAAFPRLTQRRPDAMADMVLQSQDGVDAGFERVAHRLSPDRLLALIQQGSLSLGWQYKNKQWPGLFTQFPNYGSRGWFGRVSVDQRRLLFQEFNHGWRDGDGCLSPTLVRLLPQDLRELEGRRHLALPMLITRPLERLPYAQFLPWEEARTFLQPFLSHPTPEMRIPAWSGLAGVVRFHRDRLGDFLELIEGRRNEQDPVRGAMLAGLADLPPGIWKEAHLDGLGVIFRQALDAADLSQATANHIERLLVALLPFHPDRCAGWLATVVQERGQMNYGALQYRLSDADVRRLAPAIVPVLRSWETREREPQIISLASAFGDRLEAFDELLDILERLLKSTRNVYVASGALALIAEHRHYRLASLVPALLRKDGSWATVPTVYLYLHCHRQELLTPYLGQQIVKGRFSTGKTRFVLPFGDGFHRWTPTQQALFAKTLERVTRDEERDTPAAHHAIRALAAMPDVPPVHLIWLAEEHRPRLALRDAALRALGIMDAGQGVATLLDALGDSRDRIAIYALRRALLTMPAERAFEALLAAPLDRVTVAKEVVRLIGDLKVERAFQRLLELDGQALHRDVRIALLRALWNYLDRPETWIILDRAAVSPIPAVAGSLSHIQVDRPTGAVEERLAHLFAMILGHSEPSVRLEALRRCGVMPLSDRLHVIQLPLMKAMESRLPDESRAAAHAVFSTYSGRDAVLVGDLIGRILPQRRTLKNAVDKLMAAMRFSREHLLPTVRAALHALETDPLTASLQVELAIHALPWPELPALLEGLAASDQLNPDVIATALAAIAVATFRPDAAGMKVLEYAFRGSQDERLRRLALATLIALSGPPRGWTDERLESLRAYRQDPSPLVAAAAQFTLPVEELEIGI